MNKLVKHLMVLRAFLAEKNLPATNGLAYFTANGKKFYDVGTAWSSSVVLVGGHRAGVVSGRGSEPLTEGFQDPGVFLNL
jgi:hypothetical protein